MGTASPGGGAGGRPAASGLEPCGAFCAGFGTVRSVKFRARTAHSTVTEKYDGGAAHTAQGRLWEAA
ncbi:hypothetical protein E0E62_22130 [Streptomyces sp. 16-176A]